MPQAPERPEDDATHQRPVQLLQPGQRETTPPYLLKHRSPDKQKNGAGHHVKEQRRRHGRRLERGQGPRQNYRGEYYDRGDASEDEQVPPEPDPPKHDPAQQAAYAFSPLDRAGHDERGQGRPHYQGDSVQVVRDPFPVKWQESDAVFGEEPRAPRQPREGVGQGEEGNQWMADQKTPQRGDGRWLRRGGCGGHD